MDNEATEAFATKVDRFAATLNPEEQAMLVELLVGDIEVSGFGAGLPWPGLSLMLEDAGVGNVATGSDMSGVQDTISAGNILNANSPGQRFGSR